MIDSEKSVDDRNQFTHCDLHHALLHPIPSTALHGGVQPHRAVEAESARRPFHQKHKNEMRKAAISVLGASVMLTCQIRVFDIALRASQLKADFASLYDSPLALV